MSRKLYSSKLIKGQKKPKETEITLYSDITINNGGGVVNELGLQDLKVYKELPEKCADCNSEKVIGLEVLGARDGILFWICDVCEHLHLRYTINKTIECIERCKEFWTDRSAWPIPEKSEFN